MDHAVGAEQGPRLLTDKRTLILMTGLFVLGLLLFYAPIWLWSLQALLFNLATVLSLSALLLLPGYTLLRLLPLDELATVERFAMAIGASCALLPLLLLGGWLVGWHWQSWSAWLLLLTCAGFLLWSWRRGAASNPVVPGSWRPDSELLVLLLIVLLALVSRFYPTRDLLVGMWGDSYHHTVMAWLLAENGGIFASWQPVAPLITFTYHYGFHATVAWLNWLSGQPVTGGVLMVSQAQNALAVLGVHLLTRRLTASPVAALWAALLVATLSPLPAEYLNWGRVTQLAGQLLLPVVAVAWIILMERAVAVVPARQGWSYLVRPLLLAALLTAGLVLTHYRVAVFAGCFVLVYASYTVLTQVRSPAALARLSGLGLLGGSLALLLVLPWLLRLREGALLQIGSHLASQNIGSEQTNALPPFGAFVAAYAGWPLLLLALAGLLALFWQRRWAALTLPFTAVLMFLAANPYLLGLNGAGIITNFAVLIAAYLLLAPLAGFAVATAAQLLARFSNQHLASNVQLVGAGLLLVWGMGQQLNVLDPLYILYTAADAEAVEWIRQETDPQDRLFVNSFPAYNNTLYAGSDGGWWLPLMSGRQTNLPPITYGSEAAEVVDYRYRINQFNAAIQAAPIDAPETAAALKAAGYNYLYNGPAANPANEYLQPELIEASSLYETVYQHDGVTIWRIR